MACNIKSNESQEVSSVRDEHNRTRLLLAVKKNEIDAVKQLLENATLNEKLEFLKAEDESGRSALNLAMHHGQSDVTKILQEYTSMCRAAEDELDRAFGLLSMKDSQPRNMPTTSKGLLEPKCMDGDETNEYSKKDNDEEADDSLGDHSGDVSNEYNTSDLTKVLKTVAESRKVYSYLSGVLSEIDFEMSLEDQAVHVYSPKIPQDKEDALSEYFKGKGKKCTIHKYDTKSMFLGDEHDIQNDIISPYYFSVEDAIPINEEGTIEETIPRDGEGNIDIGGMSVVDWPYSFTITKDVKGIMEIKDIEQAIASLTGKRLYNGGANMAVGYLANVPVSTRLVIPCHSSATPGISI